MKNGTFAQGTPVSEILREKYPVVFGEYENVRYEGFGGMSAYDAIKAVMEDGAEVYIDVQDVKEASPRRNERTVLTA